MNTSTWRLTLAVVFLAVSSTSPGHGQDTKFWDELAKLSWQLTGVGAIGSQATVRIPADHAFLGSADSRRFLELNGNPPRDNRFVLARTNLQWFSLFVFEDTGYVKDDEKVEPDELLKTLKAANAASQEERKQRGLKPLILEGWYVPPHYDVQTKRLEWGTKLRADDSHVVVNYTSKLLGRNGVVNAILVTSPDTLDADVKEFKAALTGFSFNEGQRYSEFRAGDKVAEYGLAGLIIGGAAAAAAKAGLFKGFGKIIGLAGLGIIAAFAAFFKRLFRRA